MKNQDELGWQETGSVTDVIDWNQLTMAYADMLTALKRVAYAKCIYLNETKQYAIIMDAADRNMVVDMIIRYDDLGGGR